MIRQITIAFVLIAHPLAGTWEPATFAQAEVGAQEEVGSAVKTLEQLSSSSNPEPAPLKGVMILRVSEEYLHELFVMDIDKTMPINRVVLGTRARGTSHTVGKADVDTKPDQNDAAFYVRIRGVSTARTVGHNGDAIICSRSKTTWECTKVVRFDGSEFVAKPATIISDTRITPMGAGSTLKGVRGRIISRVAGRRAIASNATAERITAKDTQEQVLADVNKIVEERVKKLNEHIDSRPLLSALLPRLEDVGIEFSTNSQCINVCFSGGKVLAEVCPVAGIAPRDTELWFQVLLFAKPVDEVPEVIEDAGAWLAEMMPDGGMPGFDFVGKEGVLPVDVKLIKGWVVVRSKDTPAVDDPPANDKNQ
jgi:hypothetical protein